MDAHRFPYWSLFSKEIPDLSMPDADGWATGSCPYCREPGTFRVNLKSGRWVCLPAPTARKHAHGGTEARADAPGQPADNAQQTDGRNNVAFGHPALDRVQPEWSASRSWTPQN